MSKHQLEHILQCHPIARTDISRGCNTDLFTRDGAKIVDFEAGTWAAALGHSHPRINSIIIGQIEKIMHTHYKLTSDMAEDLAINLVELLNWKDGKAIFLSSGSEAVELGMRLARLVSRGDKMLTFQSSYLSAYPSTSFPRQENAWVQVDHQQCNGCRKTECSSCSVLSELDFAGIAAFIFEPGNSGGRVLLQPNKLVKFLAREVKKQGGLIVANEVTTGLGRTGKWFGYNHYDLEPDIVTLGKALGNGYPISAVVIKKAVASSVESSNFVYAQSHQNDPLGCAIANEVIAIIKEKNLIKRTSEVGAFFLRQLNMLQQECPIIKEVRGRGLMIALELTISDVTENVFEKMLAKGYFIGTAPAANVLRFYPALTVSKKDILGVCKALKEVLGSHRVLTGKT